jgi:putative ubiquitin-RnfH superfamily antitoxin RatB of RatAB toxin-antitoxin module
MARLRIEVVYVTRETQDIVRLELEEGASAGDALASSRLQDRHPDVKFDGLKLGVFGKEVSRDTPLSDGDRVELYRPLVIDPKEARRAKARRRPRS